MPDILASAANNDDLVAGMAGDVCRHNLKIHRLAPVLKYFRALADAGRPCQVTGRDFGLALLTRRAG